MRDYSKICPKIWINETGKKIKKLGLVAQLISLYLQTNPHANMIGVYYLPISLIAHETGLNWDAVAEAIHQLSQINFCRYEETTEYMWVCDMALDQIAQELKPTDNRIRAVHLAFSQLPTLPFINEIYQRYAQVFCLDSGHETNRGFEGASKPLRSQEQEQDQDQDQKQERDMSGKPDVTPHFDLSLKSKATDVLDFLNHKARRAYRPVESNLKLIMARLSSGVTVMECRQVIAKKTREWNGNPKMSEYLRPATLFDESKFEQYMGELVMPVLEIANGKA